MIYHKTKQAEKRYHPRKCSSKSLNPPFHPLLLRKVLLSISQEGHSVSPYVAQAKISFQLLKSSFCNDVTDAVQNARAAINPPVQPQEKVS